MRGRGLKTVALSCLTILFLAACGTTVREVDNREEEPVPVIGVEEKPALTENVQEELKWKFDAETGTLRIWGKGKMEDYSYVHDFEIGKSTPTSPWGELREQVLRIELGEGVTSVGAFAFYFFEKVEEVLLPKSLDSIGEDAFGYCIRIKQIDLPEKLTSIGEGAFSRCGWLETITMPDSIQRIGSTAFANCTDLKTMKLPSGLTTISYGMFANCSDLQEVTISEGTVVIDGAVFSNCKELKKVYIPKSVAQIDDGAFTPNYSGVVCGEKDSYAETYAKEKNIEFVSESQGTEVDGTDKNREESMKPQPTEKVSQSEPVEKIEFTLTKEDILTDIIGELGVREIVYGARKIGNGPIYMVDHSSEQNVSVTKSEVTDYVMKETASEEGFRSFECSITLKKPTTVMRLKTNVYYYYADGWFKQEYPLEYILEAVSVENLKGKWTGTYNGSPYDGSSELEILESTEDGKIVAVYTCKADERSSRNKSMSYKMSGTIDFSTMFMELTIDEWIEKPYDSGLYSDIFKGYIFIDEYKIEGIDHDSNIYTVKK